MGSKGRGWLNQDVLYDVKSDQPADSGNSRRDRNSPKAYCVSPDPYTLGGGGVCHGFQPELR